MALAAIRRAVGIPGKARGARTFGDLGGAKAMRRHEVAPAQQKATKGNEKPQKHGETSCVSAGCL
ncbi:hypothetical protein [Limimonas halophila]|uniref:hypothetical protein n=1 Tax=Limimonas halophila TaxID=1082479 RepID=UPI00115FE72C|nr:hypothetical protein [Limimonas halophila]